MKNKVWENPVIISLNAKETMESNIENIGNPEVLYHCPDCGKNHGNGNGCNRAGSNKPICS